jgi:hypothetical protein
MAPPKKAIIHNPLSIACFWYLFNSRRGSGIKAAKIKTVDRSKFNPIAIPTIQLRLRQIRTI